MRWVVALGLLAMLHGSAGSALAREDWPGGWTPGRASAVWAELQPPVVEPARIEAPTFRLQVPFRTQKDGGRWQVSNCGPAVLGMVLDGYGVVDQATDHLRYLTHTYQGTWGARTGTAAQHIARVAEDFGLPTYGLYASEGQFRRWTADDIREQLRLGRPVMVLVRLYLMPGYESLGSRWGHYVLVTGMNGSGFFYSDSLKTDPGSGTGGFVQADQLIRAMQASLVPGQAVAFGGPPLAVWQGGA